MERDFVGVRVYAGGVVGSCFVKEEKMNYCYGGDYKREKEVEREKSGQGGVIYREAAPDSLD